MEKEKLIEILENRFEKNKTRHMSVNWRDVEEKLNKNEKLFLAVEKMEETGGEPDVIEFDSGLYFVDCSPESPKDRRSLCYDEASHQSRKEFKPKSSAVGMSKEMGIEILTEDEYRKLQGYGEFDTKSSSWINTAEKVRKLGGAVFADRRYDTVFVYHNGAESYYAVRGFRGKVKITT